MADHYNNHDNRGVLASATSGMPSDEQIRANLEAHLQPHSQRNPAHDVMVEVRDGSVTLTGEVPHRVMKHEIEEMAAACPGVTHVENRLNVPLTAPWPDDAQR